MTQCDHYNTTYANPNWPYNQRCNLTKGHRGPHLHIDIKGGKGWKQLPKRLHNAQYATPISNYER